MKRTIGFVLLIVLVTALLASCAPTSPSPTPSPTSKPTPTPTSTPSPTPTAKPAQSRFSLVTLRPGTQVYTTSVGLANSVNSHTDYKLQIVPQASSTGLVTVLNAGEADISLNSTNAMTTALWGVGERYGPQSKTAGPYPSIRVLVGGEYQFFNFVTTPKTGIKTMADLRGKRVIAVYPTVTTTTMLGTALLQAYGYDLDKDIVSIKAETTVAGADELAQGRVDAAFQTIGGAKLEEVKSKTGAYVIPLDPAKINTAIATKPDDMAGVWAGVVPAGWSIAEADTPSATWKNCLWVRDNFPEQAAYDLVKAILVNYEERLAIASEFRFWAPNYALWEPFDVPYHPGAIKYFKEIGKWTPQMEARQQELLKKVAQLVKK